MAIAVSLQVWKLTEISPSQKLVLLRLAEAANGEGEYAFPKVSTIAKQCCLSVSGTKAALSSLRKMGLIEVQQEHNPKRHLPTCYRLRVPMGSCEKTPGGTVSRPGGYCEKTPGGTVSRPLINRPIEPSLEPSTTTTLSTKVVDGVKKGKNGKLSEKQLRAEFEAVWKEYPDKSGKTLASKAYSKARRAGEDQTNIVAGLKRYLEYIQAKHNGGFEQKHKSGGTWFNQESWNDEYEIYKPKPKGRRIPKDKAELELWKAEDAAREEDASRRAGKV